MAPRPRHPKTSANSGILNQPRERTIRKPKLSNTPISEVFMKACEERDFKKIRACLDLEVDINCRDSDNHSALYKSLSLSYHPSNRKISDFLIEHPDLDVDQINEEKILNVACYNGGEDQLRKLCELPGIDVNAGYPVRLAVLIRNVAAINILAENSALDWNGVSFINSPIFLALENGHADIVELLLSQPSLDLGKTGYDWRSVGHIAV